MPTLHFNDLPSVKIVQARAALSLAQYGARRKRKKAQKTSRKRNRR